MNSKGALWIISLVPCLVLLKVTPSQAGCQLQRITDPGYQGCISIVGFLNTTVNTRDEICGIYSEALTCVKRYSDSVGLNCSLQEISDALQMFFNGLDNLKLDSCQVKQLTDNICVSDDRLSVYGFLSCRPYLDQMSQMDTGMACMYSKYLMDCMTQNLGMLGVSCSTGEIQRAILSPPAVTWMQSVYPGLHLDQCFQTQTLGNAEDQKCMDFMSVISMANVSNCMSLLYNMNLSNPDEKLGLEIGCSATNEVMVCMVRRAKLAGAHCTMTQMKHVIVQYLAMSQISTNLSLLGQCTVEEGYLQDDICVSDARLSNLLVATESAALSTLNNYHSKDLMCTIILATTRLVLEQLSVTCPESEVLLALLSPHSHQLMHSHYINIDVHYCAVTHGVHVANNGHVSHNITSTTEQPTTDALVSSATPTSSNAPDIPTTTATSSIPADKTSKKRSQEPMTSPFLMNRFAALSLRHVGTMNTY